MSEDLFSQVQRRIWTDKRFRALSKPEPNARDLFLYLLTTPRATTVPGLLVVGEAALAESLGWPTKGLQRCLAELETVGMVKVDRAAQLLWLPNALKHNPPRSSKNVLGWTKHWRILPECDLLTEATLAFEANLQARGPVFIDAFFRVLGRPVPARDEPPEDDVDGMTDQAPSVSKSGCKTASKMPSPIGSQEQDQEQDKEQDTQTLTGRAASDEPEHSRTLTIDELAELLRGVPGLSDIGHDRMAVSGLHEGLVMQHRGRATIGLVTQAVAALVAQGIDPEESAVTRRKVLGRFLTNQRAERPSERGTQRGAPSQDAQVALEVFGAAWSERKGCPFVRADGDERHAAKLVELAREHASRAVPGRAIVRHWAEQYLRDAEKFVADQDHPLRLLPSRVTSYGLPRARSASPVPREPALPEEPCVPPPATFVAQLAAVGTGLLQRPGGTP